MFTEQEQITLHVSSTAQGHRIIYMHDRTVSRLSRRTVCGRFDSKILFDVVSFDGDLGGENQPAFPPGMSSDLVFYIAWLFDHGFTGGKTRLY